MKRTVIDHVAADESGSALVEYMVVVLVVSAAAVLTINSVGEAVIPLFEQINDALTDALNAAAR